MLANFWKGFKSKIVLILQLTSIVLYFLMKKKLRKWGNRNKGIDMSSLPTSLWRREARYIREAKVEKLDYLGTSLSMPALVEKWTWTVRENFSPHKESLMCYCCEINAYAEAESGLLFSDHSTDIILVLSRVLLGLVYFYFEHF